jgi:membrane fusion protein, multidrug efflux system
MKIKSKSSVVSLIGLLVIIFVSYWMVVARGSDQKKNSINVQKGTLVQTTKVSKADMPQSVQALGSLEASQSVMLSAEDSGAIMSINFKNGQQVVKGMPIIQLDNVKAKADYQSAVTALKVSQSKYRRSKVLLNEAVSQQELEQLNSDVESNKAAVQKAQSVLDNQQVTAPFNGVLGTFNVQVGDYVSSGQALVNLVNTQQLKVNYTISENRRPELKLGQLAKVTVSAYPKKVFYGTVSYISPTVNADTRAMTLQAVINNDKNLLSPGMSVHVEQGVSVTKDAMVLPQEAVLADIKGYYVFRVINNHAVQTYVKIGEREGNKVQILSGIKLNEVVVSSGTQKIDDGSNIQVISGKA